MSRVKSVKTDFQKKIFSLHKNSSKHTLTLEIKEDQNFVNYIYKYADNLRKLGNNLTREMQKRLDQLERTKKYRKLKELYRKAKEKKDEKKCKNLSREMKEMQEQYDVTFEHCRKKAIEFNNNYKLDSVPVLTRAEDIWHGVERCLYGNGEKLNYLKFNEPPAIRFKQTTKGLIFNTNDDSFNLLNLDQKINFKFKKFKFEANLKDKFQRDEFQLIYNYLLNAKAIDELAINNLRNGIITDTYRPCYGTLVCKIIRGEKRVFLHITIDGKSILLQENQLGKGIVGCDIGTQTFAYTTDTEVGLKNLSERGTSIWNNEKKERKLQRALDRSRRATNPNNYSADGSIKKGKKKWIYSKHYYKNLKSLQNLKRKNAINRKLACNEEINKLRTLGDTFVTEQPNFQALKKKVKKNKDGTNKLDKNGKNARRKRFGKSIQNRCPGYFQAQAKYKFESTGGKYIEVPSEYRASQYDHTCNKYIKKKLSQRTFRLEDGNFVQRDLYSSFLLYNIDINTMNINQDSCFKTFNRFLYKQNHYINYLKSNKIKIYNSGIAI